MADGTVITPGSGETIDTRDLGTKKQQIVSTPARVVAAGTLTRPANATVYGIGDLVGDNTTVYVTCNLADLANDPVAIRRLRLDSSDVAFGGKSFRAWIYNAVPSGLAADNVTFASNRGGLVGTMSGTLRLMANGAFGVLVPDEGGEIIAYPVSGAVTFHIVLQILEASGTPTSSSTIIATMEGYQFRD